MPIAFCPLTMETATLDHLKPRAFGGRNNKLNLVVACMPCNSRRGVMSPIKFWLLKATSGALAVPAEMVR